MTHDDIVWLAGLLDGEGCFSMHGSYTSRPNQVRCRIAVSLTHPVGIQEVRRIFSEIAEQEMTVRTLVRADRPTHQQAYQVATPSKITTLRVCTAVEPYLRMKRVECQGLMMYLRKATTQRRYEATGEDRALISLLKAIKRNNTAAEAKIKILLNSVEDDTVRSA